jgi:hypothetical protein
MSGLASKPLRRFLAGCPENLLRQFSLVWPQNWCRRFLPVWPQNRRLVSWSSLKTKVVEDFPVWITKRQLCFDDLGLKIIMTVS